MHNLKLHMQLDLKHAQHVLRIRLGPEQSAHEPCEACCVVPVGQLELSDLVNDLLKREIEIIEIIEIAK